MLLRCRRIAFGLALILFIVGNAHDQSAAQAQARPDALVPSSLTSSGSTPFHLRAKISESNEPESDFTADIEEYWISPTKWRRTIKSPDFAQTRVVNGDAVYEANEGDYYPFWIRNFVLAIFEPQIIIEEYERFLLQSSSVHEPFPVLTAAEPCAGHSARVGPLDNLNTVFASWCIDRRAGIFRNIMTPLYLSGFSDLRRFGGKVVPRSFDLYLKPGLSLEARITELSELNVPDATLFTIARPALESEQIKTVTTAESALVREPSDAPGLAWPPVRGGKLSGVMSMHVSIDRAGRVREAWPLNSDNSDLQGWADEELLNWRFKPTLVDGVAVQVESVLTFPYRTTLGNAYPVLLDAEARAQAEYTVEAEFRPRAAPSGTRVTTRAFVDEHGKIASLINLGDLPSDLFGPAAKALGQWRFRPYLRDGKADCFNADVTFVVP